jgi:hypothetical protein
MGEELSRDRFCPRSRDHLAVDKLDISAETVLEC